MTNHTEKCARALMALVCPSPSCLNWKMLAFVLLIGGAGMLSSCEEFEKTYYEQQLDADGGGRKCRIVGEDIICD